MNRAWWISTVLIATVLGLAAPASAQNGDGRLGGPVSPIKVTSACPAGVGAIGVSGNLGTISAFRVLATVRMICRGGATAATQLGGYSGPEGSGSTRCGSGQVAVGIVGFEGDFIDQLAVRCRNSDLTGLIADATKFGGTSGTADGPYNCPANQWLGALAGSVFVVGQTNFAREVTISCFTPDSDGDGVPNHTDNCVAVPNPGQQAAACATVVTDTRLGGPPAIETGSTVCPPGRAVTAVAGRLSTIGVNPIVGTVRLTCEGGAAATGTLGTLATGNQGGSSCPAGQVAVGIQGREGDFVDQLALRCRVADLTRATAAVAGYGGNGGGVSRPIDCPAGQGLAGFNGTLVSGDALVRSLTIRCQPLDSDGDAVATVNDNCPLAANADQSDVDGDRIGDACDPVDDRPPVVVPAPGPGPAPAAVVTPAERITSTVSNFWTVNRRFGRLQRLVVNDVPTGATVTVTCRGNGCPFKSRRFTRNRRGQAVATKAFGGKRLRIGAAVQVRITKPGAIGRVVTFTLRRRNAVPRPVAQCLPVNSTRPQNRC
jgi:hypothetical protein